MKNIFLTLVLILMCAAAGSARRICVLSDVHVTPGNKAETALQRAVEEINAEDYDLVVMNGDLTNEGSDAEMRNVKAILDGIRHPLVVLPGNHELTWSQSATKTFFDLWGNDRFAAQLDSVLVVGIACGPYMKMGDGHVKQEDLHWLEKTLSETDAKRVLSFNHYPLMDDLDNWEDYLDILEKYPVMGHINGHYHTWRQYQGRHIPAVMTRALMMGDGTAGYAVLELTPEWVHVYNKVVGAPAEPMYAFPSVPAKPAPRKEVAVAGFTSPEGWEVEKVWVDSASVFTRLAFDKENVYFGNSLGHAVAVDKASGKKKWSHATGASLFSRPVVLTSGNVAFPGATEITVSTPAGKLLRPLPSREGPYVADGTVAGNLWIQGGYKRMELRDARTGKLRHTYDSIFNYCQAAPAVDGSEIVFGAWDTNLRSINAANGRLNWAWNNGKAANQLGPGNVVPVITEERVYTVAPDRYMTAIDRHTGATLWRDNSHRYRESLGHSADHKRVYAKTMDGELVAVDATSPNFKELWTVDLGLGYDHAPCIVVEHDGVVYAGSRRGILVAVDPAEQRVLWSLPLGKSEVNGLDIDPTTGDLWLSLIEGAIFRLHKK